MYTERYRRFESYSLRQLKVQHRLNALLALFCLLRELDNEQGYLRSLIRYGSGASPTESYLIVTMWRRVNGVEVLVAERIDWFDPLVRPSYDRLTLTDKGIGAIAKMCPILSAKSDSI